MKVNIGKYPKNRWYHRLFKIWPGDRRKVSIKIEPEDVWGLDHTLALVILPALEYYRQHITGSPFVDYDDAPHEFTPSQEEIKEHEETGDFDGLAHKRWRYVVDEMIYAFERMAKDHCEAYDLEYEDRIHNGLRLFGKYYRGLWT